MLIVRTTTFQSLIERLVKAEWKNDELEKRIEALEKRPPNTATNAGEEGYDAKTLFDELVNGVPDKGTGKVRWTYGR
jgi:hypothetical protein